MSANHVSEWIARAYTRAGFAMATGGAVGMDDVAESIAEMEAVDESPAAYGIGPASALHRRAGEALAALRGIQTLYR